MSDAPLEVRLSRHFLAWLADAGLNLAFTTYQTNRLFLIGPKPEGTLSMFERNFDRPMGLWATPEHLYMSTRGGGAPRRHVHRDEHLDAGGHFLAGGGSRPRRRQQRHEDHRSTVARDRRSRSGTLVRLATSTIGILEG